MVGRQAHITDFYVDKVLGTLTDGSNADGLHAHVDKPAQATESALEAQTNEDTYIPPDLFRFHFGVAKWWCRISASGTLVSPDYNVDSITDTGVGDRTIVFGDDFSTDVFIAHGSIGIDTDEGVSPYFSAYAVGSIRLTVRASDDGAGNHQAGALIDVLTNQSGLGTHNA